MKLVLASASPRRKKLLEELGLKFEIVLADVDEAIKSDSSPADYVKRLSLEKANSVAAKIVSQNNINCATGDTYIIGADTVVFVEGKILCKPQNETEAYEMLKMLSGREHFVFTGVSICNIKDTRTISKTQYCKTEVTFRKLDEKEIYSYIKTGEPFDKAGAYAIQGKGATLVEKINGDYYNVVGLPIVTLYKMFKTFEIDIYQFQHIFCEKLNKTL